MEQPRTWRELLLQLISAPQERQRIAGKMGINPLTLMRWAKNRSSPRQENLVPLLDSFPQHRYLLIKLIKEEFPQFFSREKPLNVEAPAIPSEFYRCVLAALVSSASMLRTQSISRLILQQILMQIDPHRLGATAIISQCVPPKEGGKIRSLREIMRHTTMQREDSSESHAQFLGTESLAGYALASSHPIVVNTREEYRRMSPAHPCTWEESAIACPILLAGSAAGSFYLASTQRNYFSQGYKKLVLEYVDLLALAFLHNEFYRLEDINLGLMPAEPVQQTHIVHFQQRVTERMIEHARKHAAIQRGQAELMIWQELEEELLHPV